MATTSWERFIEADLERLRAKFLRILRVTEFERAHWGMIVPRFRVLLAIACYDIMQPRTKTVETIEHVLYHSVMTALDAYFELDIDWDTDTVLQVAIDRAFDRAWDVCLHSTLVDEYKMMWHAAEIIKKHWVARRARHAIVIQRAWREAISNPAHKRCRDRLMEECAGLRECM
jgi:hypothetical protein